MVANTRGLTASASRGPFDRPPNDESEVAPCCKICTGIIVAPGRGLALIEIRPKDLRNSGAVASTPAQIPRPMKTSRDGSVVSALGSCAEPRAMGPQLRTRTYAPEAGWFLQNRKRSDGDCLSRAITDVLRSSNFQVVRHRPSRRTKSNRACARLRVV